jgi:hypothetical protein
MDLEELQDILSHGEGQYTHILHQYIKTSINRDQNVRKRAQNNIDENSEYDSPMCPSSTVHIDGIDAQSVPK